MKPIERKSVFSEIFGRTLLENGYIEKKHVFYKLDNQNEMLKYMYMVSLAAGHGVKICFDIVPFSLNADPTLPQSKGYETFTLDDVYLRMKGTHGCAFGTDCCLEDDFRRVMQNALDEFKEVLLVPLNRVNNLADYIDFMENHDEEKARTVARKAIEAIESILNDACTMSVLTERKKAEYMDRIEQLRTEMENGFCTYRMRIADNKRQSILLNRSFFEKAASSR